MDIIAVIGKTSSAKDLIGKYLREKYGFGDIVSYTTRKMRDYEKNGLQHKFIDDDEMDRVLKEEDILAYTENAMTGIRYCASLQCATSDKCVYIINPNGLKWGIENGGFNDVDNLYTIYVYCSEERIMEFSSERGDDLDTFMKRLESERKEFDDYFCSHDWNYCIYNLKDKEYLFEQADEIMASIGYEKLES